MAVDVLTMFPNINRDCVTYMSSPRLLELWALQRFKASRRGSSQAAQHTYPPISLEETHQCQFNLFEMKHRLSLCLLDFRHGSNFENYAR